MLPANLPPLNLTGGQAGSSSTTGANYFGVTDFPAFPFKSFNFGTQGAGFQLPAMNDYASTAGLGGLLNNNQQGGINMTTAAMIGAAIIGVVLLVKK